MISMEFAVSTKVLWPWFCKKRKHQKKEKKSEHNFTSPVKCGMFLMEGCHKHFLHIHH